MKYIDHEKVNTAIRDCLERCYQSTDILPKMAEFLRDLKTIEGWRNAEIHEVEFAVLKVLRGVVDGAVYAGDATNRPVEGIRLAGSEADKVTGI